MPALSAEQIAVIEKVKKLLALAANNTSEAEAEAAADKAMKLLEAYNLEMHNCADHTKTMGAAARDDKKRNGGLYGWQRELWQSVADLNFCMYWSIRGLQRGQKYEHRILGAQANVIATEVMADYLQSAVERMAHKFAREQGFKSVFVREAIAYREGCATRLVYRLWDLRNQRMQEEKATQAAAKAANPTGPTANALVLADIVSTEYDLNCDFLYGEPAGTNAARRKANEARRATAQRLADELIAKRDAEELANPKLKAARLAKEAKENAEREAKWAKQSQNCRSRQPTAREVRESMGGFSRGYNDGGTISLNQQVAETKTK